ncbi:MAG: U32 family peptidase [Lentisphaerae bacterium]|nr:U32 family peptidase [Lentisphaerota bacterium]
MEIYYRTKVLKNLIFFRQLLSLPNPMVEYMSYIELLAPAGSPAALAAALAAGADAVYAGLPRFNARERGENFTVESMRQAIAYAHKLKRKVYITLNTLVKEQELTDLAEYVAEIADMDPDAVIVQDLGVLRMIREFFPDLTIHASTQMGIHNSAGVRMAERLGVKRVILERQVTLEELDAMRKASNMELEIFCNGALCCSLSGSCLFSSYLGGASGNRGKCKQPCRRRFFAKEGNGFFFSTSDLATLEMIPKFRQMNIASLKIEGRLKQPDYVYNAVKAYRTVLDAPEVTPEIIGEARQILSNTCSRRWSSGFFSEKSMQNLVRHDALGASGTLLGRVVAVGESGFNAELKQRLHIGDRLRVQPLSGDEGSAFTLTKLFIDRKIVSVARPGDVVYIPCDKPVAANGLLYKTGVSHQVDVKAMESTSVREKLELSLLLEKDQLQVNILNCDSMQQWSYPEIWQMASKHPTSADTLREAFASGTALFEYKLQSVVLAPGAENCFIPASVLKKVRRAFDEAVSVIETASLRKAGAAGLMKFFEYYRSMTELPLNNQHMRETVAMRPHGASAGNPKAWKAVSILDLNNASDEAILPDFCPESKLPGLQRAIARAYAQGVRRFRAASLFELELLAGYEDIVVSTTYPLPVCNSLAIQELSELGVQRVQAALELERSSIEELRKHSTLELEVYRYGRPALLTTRATLPAEGDIEDNRANKFSIRSDKRQGLTRLYARSVFSIPHVAGTADFYDLTQARWNEPETNTFNFDKEWL